MCKATMMQHLKIPRSTFSRELHRHHIVIPYYREQGKELKRILIENYHSMPICELAKKIGKSQKYTCEMAKRLGLRHTEEEKAEILESARHRMHAFNKSADFKRKRVEAQRESIKKERLRMRYGLRQKTGMKLSELPRNVIIVKCRLRGLRQYFDIEGEPYSVGYDSNTKRSPQEQYYTKRYGLEFFEVEDE